MPTATIVNTAIYELFLGNILRSVITIKYKKMKKYHDYFLINLYQVLPSVGVFSLIIWWYLSPEVDLISSSERVHPTRASASFPRTSIVNEFFLVVKFCMVFTWIEIFDTNNSLNTHRKGKCCEILIQRDDHIVEINIWPRVSGAEIFFPGYASWNI